MTNLNFLRLAAAKIYRRLQRGEFELRLMHLYYEISINYNYRIIDLKKRLIKYSDNYRRPHRSRKLYSHSRILRDREREIEKEREK
jgi:hypothetical protein